MSLIATLAAFVVTILVIVAIHEYGHFLAMRAFGIRVLKFSIGFGPSLLSWKSKKSGTEYVIASVPLGGFVKPYDSRGDNSMLEGEQGEVDGTPEEDFALKPAWQRLITYAAGPFANFVLAAVLYWAVAVIGQFGLVPHVGQVDTGSIAASAGVQAGDKLVMVNDRPVKTWQDVSNAMLTQIGTDNPVLMTLDREGVELVVSMPLGDWASNPDSSPLDILGIEPGMPATTLGQIVPEGAADKAGLLEGDKVKRVNNQEVASWAEWVEQVQSQPGQALAVEVERQGRLLTLTLVPDTVEADGKTIGRAGVMIGGLTRIQYGPVDGLWVGLERVKQETAMITVSMWRLVTGHLSVKSLGGPITIAKVAGETAAVGLTVFLTFLAFFSISLGVLNLLPVPLLDGGWIVFCFIEMLLRKPLPERFLVMAQSAGLSLVILLMVVAIYNDILRQFG